MDQKRQLPPGNQCCNLDFLEVSLGRNRKAVLRLVGMFLDGYPALMQRLQKSLAANDLAGLRRVLHDIRGNCVLFSAQECLSQTIRLEGLLRTAPALSDGEAEGTNWPAEFSVLQDALERLHDELSAYLTAASP